MLWFSCLLLTPGTFDAFAEVNFDAFPTTPKNHYVEACRQAIIEKKHLAVWVRSDVAEGITEGVNPKTVCLYLKQFPDCEWSDTIRDGDAVYSENRGDWFEVTRIRSASGAIKFTKATSKPSLQVRSVVEDCPTGN